MAHFVFSKATKSTAKLRAALFGPSGAGKTFTALRIATGLGGRIAVIDTERGSASKYADRFEFDVLELDRPSVDNYVAAIQAAGEAGYAVLIADSLSHPWQELLQEIDRLASAKYKGNTWSAWSEGTPKQRRLVDAILAFPGHVVATMRSKTEWSVETGSGNKTKPVRIGLAPEQGKGIEYEFDLLLELSQDHIGQVVKDRTGKFQDQTVEKPGEDFGRALAEWLGVGDASANAPKRMPTGEPQHEDNLPPETATNEMVVAFVRRLVARATETREWGKADTLAAERLSGEALAYAREQLDLACDAARTIGATETAETAPEIDSETRAKVDRLVAQAARLGNWEAARETASARFEGAALHAALDGIRAAQERAATDTASAT